MVITKRSPNWNAVSTAKIVAILCIIGQQQEVQTPGPL
jgi:hypothetical protein